MVVLPIEDVHLHFKCWMKNGGNSFDHNKNYKYKTTKTPSKGMFHYFMFFVITKCQ